MPRRRKKMMVNKKQKVLLIGWDAADWKIINRLMDKGEMPALKSMVENGVMGNISTLEPAYSPMLWTTIATGKYPDKHGILGFSEPTPDHSAIRPVSNSSRKVKALWNILTQNGFKTHVINWWPSYPAEPVNGIYISNMFPKVKSPKIDDRRLPVDTVYPAELQDLFAHFKVHPLELSMQHIRPFMPDADFSKVKIDKKFETLARLIAEATTVHAAATLALEQEEWDFAAIYWDTIDHFCHSYMKYAPPRLKEISDDEFKNYHYVIDGAYRLMDQMLARLMQIAGEDCTVILISDHGFKSGKLRRINVPNEPAGPAAHHRNVGIFCAKGPGIRKDEIIYGASLLDITPTILTLLGLPIGKDMDGKSLVEIFEKNPVIDSISSWEEVPGECGMISDEKRDLDSEHSAEAIQQLIELGYIEDPGPDIKKAVERTIDELNYNLAVVYYGTDRFAQALPLLENLFSKYPHRGRYIFKMINCYLDAGETEKAESQLEIFRKNANNKLLSKEAVKAIKARKVPEILTEKEKKQWIKEYKNNPLRENTQAKNDLLQLFICEGDILLQRGFKNKALQKYREIENKNISSKSYLVQMGRAFLKTKQWRDASKMYEKLINLDNDHANGHLGAGIAAYQLKNFDKALEHFIDSVSLNFYNHITHFNIGRTLFESGDFSNSANALEISLRINPNFGLARNLLIEIYEQKLLLPEKAKVLRGLYTLNDEVHETIIDPESELIIMSVSDIERSNPIIIVSGLPRSGTSMMMQLLETAGIPIYTDGKRLPDESNPKGFYEHENVKQLIRNKKWLNETVGMAVKIVIPLLYKLPPNYNYKVIFMHRDLDEIIDSQHRMLLYEKKIAKENYSMTIKENFQKFLNQREKWSSKNKNVEIIDVNYNEIVENPESSIEKIKNFLGIKIDNSLLVNQIDKELYRIKK
jgi:predicted AlkP superfamily phosphohydrolase/phosphomutase/predicted Zn-dependent protease